MKKIQLLEKKNLKKLIVICRKINCDQNSCTHYNAHENDSEWGNCNDPCYNVAYNELNICDDIKKIRKEKLQKLKSDE